MATNLLARVLMAGPPVTFFYGWIHSCANLTFGYFDVPIHWKYRGGAMQSSMIVMFLFRWCSLAVHAVECWW